MACPESSYTLSAPPGDVEKGKQLELEKNQVLPVEIVEEQLDSSARKHLNDGDYNMEIYSLKWKNIKIIIFKKIWILREA